MHIFLSTQMILSTLHIISIVRFLHAVASPQQNLIHSRPECQNAILTFPVFTFLYVFLNWAGQKTKWVSALEIKFFAVGSFTNPDFLIVKFSIQLHFDVMT